MVLLVSVHFRDFWNLSVRKPHSTPSLWRILCWFVSFCHFYFRFSYLIHLSCCMVWKQSNVVCFPSGHPAASASFVSSLLSPVCCSWKQDWFIHFLSSHFAVTEYEYTPAFLRVEPLCSGTAAFHWAASAFLNSHSSLAVFWVDPGWLEGLPVLMVQSSAPKES